jgi:hypothetical protein
MIPRYFQDLYQGDILYHVVVTSQKGKSTVKAKPRNKSTTVYYLSLMFFSMWGSTESDRDWTSQHHPWPRPSLCKVSLEEERALDLAPKYKQNPHETADRHLLIGDYLDACNKFCKIIIWERNFSAILFILERDYFFPRKSSEETFYCS